MGRPESVLNRYEKPERSGSGACHRARAFVEHPGGVDCPCARWAAQPTADPGITFGAYSTAVMDRWEPNDKDPEHGLKFTTWNDYKCCLRKRLVPAIGDKLLTSIQRRDARALGDQFRREGLSATNIRKHVRIVSSIRR